MDLLRLSESFLYSISTALYYPVTVGLALLVFAILVMLGALLREHLDRRRGRRVWVEGFRVELERLARTLPPAEHELEAEHLLQGHEIAMMRPVELARFVVRAGPGIGLMGTLIPMGIALAAVAQGSMPAMAQHMVHAFNAAVVGLGSGVVAFAVALLREQWLRADVAAMRYAAEQLLRGRLVPDERVESTAAVGRVEQPG